MENDGKLVGFRIIESHHICLVGNVYGNKYAIITDEEINNNEMLMMDNMTHAVKTNI
jgi:hypothetical protein